MNLRIPKLYTFSGYQVTFRELWDVTYRSPIYIAKISQKDRVAGYGHIFVIYFNIVHIFIYMAPRGLVLHMVKVWTYFDVFLTYFDVK